MSSWAYSRDFSVVSNGRERWCFRIALAAGACKFQPHCESQSTVWNQPDELLYAPDQLCSSRMSGELLVGRASSTLMRSGSESSRSISKNDLSPPPYQRCLCAAMRVVVAWANFEVAHSFSHFCQVARKYFRLVTSLVKSHRIAQK